MLFFLTPAHFVSDDSVRHIPRNIIANAWPTSGKKMILSLDVLTGGQLSGSATSVTN